MSELRWYTSSHGFIEFQMTLEQAESATHPGPCDDDVRALSNEPAIRAQLDKIDPEKLRYELSGYGAWDDEELKDHELNLQRILWLAAGEIVDRSAEDEDETSAE